MRAEEVIAGRAGKKNLSGRKKASGRFLQSKNTFGRWTASSIGFRPEKTTKLADPRGNVMDKSPGGQTAPGQRSPQKGHRLERVDLGLNYGSEVRGATYNGIAAVY